VGWWTDIKPRRLRPRAKGSPWLFAVYTETPSERDDGQWLVMLLFRDKGRRRFGKLEHRGMNLPQWDAREVATKVVLEKSYRDSLLSDDPSLPDMWKRR
jgi:hypothetical protein